MSAPERPPGWRGPVGGGRRDGGRDNRRGSRGRVGPVRGLGAGGGAVVAFGYVRSVGRDELVLDGWHEALVREGAAAGYAVGDVFADRAVPDDAVDRPGLEALAGALATVGGLWVLVPTWDHLSPVPAVRAGLVARLEAAGGRVSPARPVPTGPRVPRRFRGGG